MFKSQLFRINQIAAMLYQGKRPSSNLVIFGMGAPTLPDKGQLDEAFEIMKYDTDLLVPDYIGFGRSDGKFTPKGCIDTFLMLYDELTKGCIAKNNYEKITKNLKYKRILFVGRSFGGTYLPLLPKYNKNIIELCLVFPAIHNSVYGQIHPEESNEDFMRMMELDGYSYLYRGIMNKVWVKHLAEKDHMSPMDDRNIRHLKNAKIFIGHGDSDDILHHSRTTKFFNKLESTFPEKQDMIYKLYKNRGHNSATSSVICRDFLRWSDVAKRK